MTRHFWPVHTRVLRRGVTYRQRVRRRLAVHDDRHDPSDLITALSSLTRILRSGQSLRQAIIEVGNHETSGVIHLLALRLSSGQSLDKACGDLLAKPHTARSIRLPGHQQETEGALVINVIELAYSMGGNEAQLIDSMIHTLIERRHIRLERQTQAATALSSMRMLTYMPVICGLWIVSESESSRTFIFHTAAGYICLGLGITLNVIGRVWSSLIVSSSM